ncbi:metal-dependent hydrolase [Halovenus sp. WSH3]|uniref:Metal-dependent hydrolase n=1 Tax=Halovenus carboxidivorans TaxID=2692199 RepID=A0A6B0TAN6_9EURY|nr:metal-dependent hydrolase [Halovenus carboxidivorans]MXR50239.1 metal-dependent hydrolase [Halovenus carboxidivorans]
MLFPTHLLAAAMVGRTSRLSTPWAVVGAALPDVIDKPLGLVGVADIYHTVGHSVLVLGVLAPLVLGDPRGRAVVVGWALHLALDAGQILINGRPSDVLSLGWPAVAPPDPLGLPPGEFALYYLGSPAFVLEVGIWLLAAAVVLRDRRAAGGEEATHRTARDQN